jgi:predicted MFS family arabinose efflux permease
VLGIAGTDLVLPAVPALPEALGGTAAEAQLVLAAFVAGAGLGLLLFGELGARYDQRLLLAGSLGAYAAVSAAAAWAHGLDALIALRFAQGAAGSAAAVFAPGFIRALYDHDRAMRSIGLLSSIESLVPAFAPLLGIWLLDVAGWRSSFVILAALSLALALLVAAMRGRLPRVEPAPSARGYTALLRDPVYLRYALSHAFTLGGLLTFVFGAPAVIVATMGGTLGDFAVMQVSGIAFFIVAANVAGRVSARVGAERTIFLGTLLSAAGGAGILLYGLAGGRDPLLLAALFVPMNLGLGLRGPPGFLLAIVAAQGDDARGAALLVLFILLTAAAGTAVAAPFITSGLAALAAVAAAICLAALLCLLALPKLDQAGSTSAATVSSIQPPPSTRSPS